MFVAMAMAIAFLAPAPAHAETRTLNLYNTHTRESAKIAFKRNGRYIHSGLQKLNRFLRDHRRNEPTRMDPELFDLIWEVYRASGATKPIHVVSGYRSPATNAMLRRTRGGQARKSQHMLGKAMDFFIPGISSTSLRKLAFQLQGGGVGYYPRSATPYVHLDTGNVRAWPRMSRSQLTRLFPDGKTLHLPPDGKRLPGYDQALAAYQARKRAGKPPTFGRARARSGGRRTLLGNLFSGDRGDQQSQPVSQPAAASARQRRTRAPQTPRTVLAALPSSALPLPVASSRSASAGEAAATAPQPAADVTDTARRSVDIEPSGEDEAREPATLLAALPLPDRRPPADAPSDRVHAAAVVQPRLAAAYAPPRPERPGVDLVPPQQRPSGPLHMAALVPEPAPAADEDRKGVRIGVPAPRPSQQPDMMLTASLLFAGAATTPRKARPSAHDAANARQPLIDAQPTIDPARFGWRNHTPQMVSAEQDGMQRPDFAMNADRAAPAAVYAVGFDKRPPVDPHRLSGNAVTFLAVARFAEAGGDGQPLQLQIPATN